MKHRYLEGACCKHTHRRNRTFGKKFGTRKKKKKTESEHKGVMEIRNVGMPYREEELKGKQTRLANQIQKHELAGNIS